MKYIADTIELQIEKPTIVTLGRFDGKHRGHQKLLRTIMGPKAGMEYPAVIFTFDMAPGTAVTDQSQIVITTSLERRANVEKVGIDYLAEHPFTDGIRHMEPEAFARDILASRMHAREIVVGPDCSSGYKGAGSAALLPATAYNLGYHLHAIKKEKDHRRGISSTHICGELEKGNTEKANRLLGQSYTIHREVAHGNHIGGSPLDFPTANIPSPLIKRLPRYGVYVSCVLVDGVHYRGVINIGKKPTVGGEYPTGVETYIFGLKGDIYDKNIEAQIPAFDRLEQEFTPFEKLKEWIGKDREFANTYYKERPEVLVEE